MRLHWQLYIATPVAGCSLLCGCMNPNTYTTPRTLNPGDVQFQVAPEFYGGSFTQTVPKPGGAPGVNTETSRARDVRFGTRPPSSNPSVSPQRTAVFVFHAPLLIGWNLSEALSIVVSPGVAYALATSSITTGDTYAQATGSSGFMVRGGLGVDIRFSKKFALHPEVTLLKGFGDTEPLLYLIGIGVNFGAMPDYSDLAAKAAPPPAPGSAPPPAAGGT